MTGRCQSADTKVPALGRCTRAMHSRVVCRFVFTSLRGMLLSSLLPCYRTERQGSDSIFQFKVSDRYLSVQSSSVLGTFDEHGSSFRLSAHNVPLRTNNSLLTNWIETYPTPIDPVITGFGDDLDESFIRFVFVCYQCDRRSYLSTTSRNSEDD